MEIPVYIETTACKCIGTVNIEKEEDFEDAADKLWESQDYDAPTLCHACADAELGDWDVSLSNIDYYFKKDPKDQG